MAAQTSAPARKAPTGDSKMDNTKRQDVRKSNMLAARAVADAVRTSLGPKGMDKMITGGSGVVITNDGATILDKMQVTHPAAKMLVELSKSQDVEAGDGTTSVVVLSGALLERAEELLSKGIHPTHLADAWKLAHDQANTILRNMAKPVELSDRGSLIQAAVTSLNSKVISQHSEQLAPLAVDAVLNVIDSKTATNVDLRDIRVVTKVGGTVDDTELVDGLLLKNRASRSAGGPTRIENPKIGLIQFQLSAPKTDMESNIIVKNNQEIDRLAREEKKYILKMVKTIAKTGCNVLLIQKSILRDAVNVLSLHYLAKKKIMCVTDIERDEVEFICKTLGCRPVASIDGFSADKLGSADLAEEQGSLTKILGVKNPGKTVSVLVRGSNELTLGEAERSLHDALCVVRCLVKEKYLMPGGGAGEAEVALRLREYAETLAGINSYCVKAYADALEVIPYTLAENSGLHPTTTVTKLNQAHAAGGNGIFMGINVNEGGLSNMWEAGGKPVIQPLLVNVSAINLATECARMILKIDDILASR